MGEFEEMIELNFLESRYWHKEVAFKEIDLLFRSWFYLDDKFSNLNGLIKHVSKSSRLYQLSFCGDSEGLWQTHAWEFESSVTAGI